MLDTEKISDAAAHPDAKEKLSLALNEIVMILKELDARLRTPEDRYREATRKPGQGPGAAGFTPKNRRFHSGFFN